MSLAAGTQLGAHHIVGLLGAGGMGEVYRARDTRLNREVAIKILPPQYAADPDRIARFEREAHAVAALNHPGIAAIHEFSHTDGIRFLVLELVEGDTLADLLRKRGALGVEEALAIARDICAALEAAHEKGICHRDLKPANVKVTPDGAVKVLDFGLAKILESNPAAPSVTNSPTLSLAGTYPGVILGTAGYMSPEQAKGFAADPRSDIFSLGCLLYELLTGRRAFEGDTSSDVLAAVLKTEPDLAHLPRGLNPRIVDLLGRCLEKNPKKRWHAVADVRVELDTILERRAFTDEARAGGRSSVRHLILRHALPIAGALAAGVIVGALAMGILQPRTTPQITRFAVTLPENQQLAPPNRALVALSPDGTKLVYHTGNGLFLRELSDLNARAIPGTETLGPNNVVFSPDGRSVAFHATADRTFKRIAITGGAAVTICSVPSPRTPNGMTWSEHGIVFAIPGTGIYRVAASGGTPEQIVVSQPNEIFGGPHMLPHGRALLFSVATTGSTNLWDTAKIVAQRLDSSDRTTLIEGGSEARFVPTGHLVYAVGGTLLAVPFDVDEIRVLGSPVPVIEGVRRTQSAPNAFRAAHFSFSDEGSLAYVPGPTSAAMSQAALVVMDRAGNAKYLNVPAGAYYAPRVSPDGRFLAVATDDQKEESIWVYELAGTSALQRLTFTGRNRHPVWSRDGEFIAYQSNREGDEAIFRQRADGTGEVERLTKPEKGAEHIPHAWSPTQDVLLFTVRSGTRYALWRLNVRERHAVPWGSESGIQAEAVFSPDGKWVAYQSDETSLSEIYVQPAAGGGPKYMVPRDLQNHHPLWSPKGNELFYIPRQGVKQAIPVTTAPRFAFGKPVQSSAEGESKAPRSIAATTTRCLTASTSLASCTAATGRISPPYSARGFTSS